MIIIIDDNCLGIDQCLYQLTRQKIEQFFYDFFLMNEMDFCSFNNYNVKISWLINQVRQIEEEGGGRKKTNL